MIILAIDPGPKESAYVVLSDGQIIEHDYMTNDRLLSELLTKHWKTVVIEWIEGYGLTVGRETFETCYWVGRFTQAAGGSHLLGRKAIKSHLCSTLQAKDSHIRAALIDRFGAPGTKKKPGPTYGLVGDEWSALAVAVTWVDTHTEATA